MRMIFDKADGGEMERRASKIGGLTRDITRFAHEQSPPEISADYLQSKLDVMRDLS